MPSGGRFASAIALETTAEYRRWMAGPTDRGGENGTPSLADAAVWVEDSFAVGGVTGMPFRLWAASSAAEDNGDDGGVNGMPFRLWAASSADWDGDSMVVVLELLLMWVVKKH